MPDEYAELLVVADIAVESGPQWEELRRAAAVTQTLPPRLALVRVRGARDALPLLPGLTYVEPRMGPDGPSDLPADLPTDLSAEERLFVDAWRLRQEPKSRIGDGASWDAPGFDPPDRPMPREAP